MGRESLTEFSGVAGKVLQRAIGGGRLITGIVVGFFLLVASWVLVLLDAVALSTPLIQVVMAVVLARFAVNGLYGEWGGTVFSGVGGPWTTVLRVAGRYLALTAIWLLPMLLLGAAMRPDAATDPLTMLMNGKLMTLAALYVLAMTLTPPVFLIASVGAESFAELFSPEHWKAMFSGRKGDLFVVYVVYTGALGMVLLLAITPVVLAFSLNRNLGFVVAGLCCILLFGVSIDLLGRLSGFFACGELGLSDPPTEAVPVSPAQPPRGPSPLQEAPPVSHATNADVDAPPAPAPGAAAAAARAQSQAQAEAEAEAWAEAQAEAQAQTAAAAVVAPSTEAGRATAVVAAPQVASRHDPTRVASVPKRRPPLLDGQQRVEAALRRFALDPDGALSALQDLTRTFAPQPHVLQAYAICLYQTSHTEAAIEVARDALQLAFDRGHTQLAAGLFATMYREYETLGFNREQLLTVATSLERSGDLATAARAYSTVIGEDHGSVQAIKGLLQVAERILTERSHPAAAIKVYRYLMEHCSDSPLWDYMTQGLAQAERCLAEQSGSGS